MKVRRAVLLHDEPTLVLLFQLRWRFGCVLKAAFLLVFLERHDGLDGALYAVKPGYPSPRSILFSMSYEEVRCKNLKTK
jgi:hypothetical protein